MLYNISFRLSILLYSFNVVPAIVCFYTEPMLPPRGQQLRSDTQVTFHLSQEHNSGSNSSPGVICATSRPIKHNLNYIEAHQSL
jgi:hypothetical protein